MKNRSLNLQMLACKYMEKTYGKDWEEKLNLSHAAITNAYIQGRIDKENEDKTADRLLISQKRFDRFKEEVKNLVENSSEKREHKVFGFDIMVEPKMPEHLGALVDGEGSILSFIEFK